MIYKCNGQDRLSRRKKGICLVGPQFGAHRKYFTLQSVHFGVREKFGMKLIPGCLANALCNFFVIEEVFFGDDLNIGFFGTG